MEHVTYGNGEPGLKGKVNEMWTEHNERRERRRMDYANLTATVLNLLLVIALALMGLANLAGCSRFVATATMPDGTVVDLSYQYVLLNKELIVEYGDGAFHGSVVSDAKPADEFQAALTHAFAQYMAGQMLGPVQEAQ